MFYGGLGLTAAALSFLLWGSVFHFGFDEGIYLVGADRVLRGEVPYRDFFSLTGPGSYYLYAGVFSIFGHAYLAARLWLCLEIGVVVASIVYVVQRLSARTDWAIGAATFFLGLCATVPFRLFVNHRWDSAAAMSLALCFALQGSPLACGAFAALGCLFTPAVGPVAVALAFFTGKSNLRRFIAGFGGIAGVALAVMGVTGALWPMYEQVVRFAPHYAKANIVWPTLLPPSSGILGMSNLIVLLPVVSLLFCFLLPKHRTSFFALICASLVSIAPRFEPGQILFALPIMLSALFAALATRVREPLANGTILCLPLMLLCIAAKDITKPEWLDTEAGRIRVEPNDTSLVKRIVRMHLRGERIFVYPYSPIVYFLSGAIPSSRYSFLQPGMMSEEDEVRAVADVVTAKPSNVITVEYPARQYESIWPAVRHGKLAVIDRFIGGSYAVRETAVGSGMTVSRLTPFSRAGPGGLCRADSGFAGSRNLTARGPADAPTVVEFADFQCPYCGTMAKFLKQILEGPLGHKVRFEFRHFPLATHSWARQAAEDAACVSIQSSDAFWVLQQQIFARQLDITDENVHEKISEFAGGIPNINLSAYTECVKNSASVGIVADDTRLGTEYGISGTPTLIVNGKKAGAVRTAADLRALIEHALH